MAITRSKQAKQMLQDGGMLVQPGFGGTRQGYRSAKSMESKAASAKSSSQKSSQKTTSSGSNAREDYIKDYYSQGIVKGGGKKVAPGVYQDARLTKDQTNRSRDFQALQKFKSNMANQLNIPLGPFQFVLNKAMKPNFAYRNEFLVNNPQLKEYLESLDEDDQKKAMVALADVPNITGQNFEDFLAFDKGAPGLKYRGNVGGLEKFVSSYKTNPDGTFALTDKGYKQPLTYGYRRKPPDGSGGDGEGIMSDYERRLLALEDSPEKKIDDEFGGGQNFRLLAKGGMADPVVGGEMDFESARQMYGLGKLVKKVTRSVKKIAKSPIGKAAIGAALFNFAGGGGAISNFFGKGSFNPFLAIKGGDPVFSGLGAIANKAGLVNLSGGLTGFGTAAAIGIPSILGALTADDDDEEETYKGADIADPRFIMSNPYKFINPRQLAEGGSTEGKEPVAKKTMPLLDMGGMEKDYRADGGFVPIGRMEKADDVPARLSKNEFVFTADAVRNAGDGDVDKGAEVMYNMMKNLEAGGDVSEESQGLEGARKMFETSQRLEEVI